jgi:1-deoxyxylulose-5-phosphate synthase
MEYAVLGPTGVRVSRICLGTATFGVAPSPLDAERVVHAALDLGINFFDTADTYGALGRLRPARRAACWRPRVG